ncbi:MAG: NifU family protein [bacterium]|nr:NifU family protein [bacterium]
MKLEQQLSLEQKVDDVLNELKPMLATHGGDVRLVNITKDKVAEVEFIGSCVGCSIVDVTLNNGLKEAILLSIPEISDVLDVTKHHE